MKMRQLLKILVGYEEEKVALLWLKDPSQCPDIMYAMDPLLHLVATQWLQMFRKICGTTGLYVTPRVCEDGSNSQRT